MLETVPSALGRTFEQAEVDFRVFRAIVVDVSKDEKTQSWHIFIKNSSSYADSDGNVIEAIPPSAIPFTSDGSGSGSVPDEGAECIVALHPDSPFAQILTYTTKTHGAIGGIEGEYPPERNNPGGLYLKIGGRTASVLSLQRNGEVYLAGGYFASIGLDGLTKTLKLRDENYEHVSAIGRTVNRYIPTDDHTGLEEVTMHTSHYGQFYENPVFSDVSTTTESNFLPGLFPYVGKSIIRAGSIVNRNLRTDLYTRNPYQIETRQSTGNNPTMKDTTVVVRFGDQAGRNIGAYKYGTTQFHPRGIMLEFEGKRMNTLSSSTFLWRFGKLEGDIQKRSTLTLAGAPGVPTEAVKGEIFRFQIHDDIIPKLGTPGLDSMGEGLGYEFGMPNNKTKQQYLESFGKFTSTLALPAFKNTYWRKYIHSYASVPTSVSSGSSRYQTLGGNSSIYFEAIEQVTAGISSIRLTKELLSTGYVMTAVKGDISIIADESYLTSKTDTLQVTATANFIRTLRDEVSSLTDQVATVTGALSKVINLLVTQWVPVPMDGGALLKTIAASSLAPEVGKLITATGTYTPLKNTINALEHNK